MSLIKLASGGTATVYAGLDLATGELVALKRPHEHLASDPSFQRSLRAEVNIASRIVHPNVVSIVDVEQVDDMIRLVMPYVRGASLSELLVAAARTGRIEPEVALRMVADACAGLHAAHELRDDAGRLLGIVHRDISPHNLMVGVDGVTRVTDFGIAKSVDVHAEHSTTTGVLKGKFAYMAPEYIHGGAIDRRADVFALGVVLWESLAGQRLFKGTNPIESSRNVLEKPAPSLATIAPELGRFDPLVAMALEKQPEARVPTARAWLDALERLPMAGHEAVARVVERLVGDALAERQAAIQKRLLVMAEVTSTGAYTSRDTILTTTGFDPEDLAPTLVVPIPTEISGVQAAQTSAEEPSTLLEPRPVSAALLDAQPSPPTRRRAGWIVGGAFGLAAAGVLTFAALHPRQQASSAASPAEEPKPVVAQPTSSVRPEPVPDPTSDRGNVVDLTPPPQPPAHPSPPRPAPSTKPLVVRAAPSSSAAPATSDSPIIRHVELGGRPNPYAK